jgi:hypothetical protein
MRYNAFFGELPLEAFQPKLGGGMRLHGGGNPISAVTDAIGGAVSSVGDLIGSAANTVGNAVGDIVQTVADHPLEAAALAAGGYYFAPEIGAWLASDGTALAGTEAGVSAGTVPTTADALASSGSGLGLTGSEGLASGGTTNLASMGGAQGLTGATTAGTIAGAEGGSLASGGLGAGLGLSNAATGLGAGAAGGSALSGMLPYMVAGQVATGLLGADAAKKAADIQSAAAQNATALQGQMFNTINQQQAPYRTAGYGALNQIGGLGGGQYTTYDQAGNPTGTAQGSGYLTHQFDATDLQKGLAPNYDFMLQQGQMANQRAANMGGGAIGGNALQGLNKYTQDYAGNAYQNAFNNYQGQRTNIYNTLAGIAGIGQTGQTATNTAAANATNAASQLGVGSAAAQAAGQVGSANALSNTVSGLGNTYMLSQLLNQGGRVA